MAFADHLCKGARINGLKTLHVEAIDIFRKSEDISILLLLVVSLLHVSEEVILVCIFLGIIGLLDILTSVEINGCFAFKISSSIVNIISNP